MRCCTRRKASKPHIQHRIRIGPQCQKSMRSREIKVSSRTSAPQINRRRASKNSRKWNFGNSRCGGTSLDSRCVSRCGGGNPGTTGVEGGTPGQQVWRWEPPGQ
ncbi:hypothetical protein POM88_051010 [Heracleum sosnowskyi]|uniref:Uncharacterized protein n=1 Tax=Heracleum sosnowskyi TaxID=360622 RepID=A0AAD8M2Z3_9APIA|nr:hypothetical protein POM88_051010 [Heracleum sosnowskyi]